MPIYSKVIAPVNYNKQYRANNGTVWNYRDYIKFWLRASADEFVDRAKVSVSLSSTGTGTFTNQNGPKVRYPFKSLNFNNKYYTTATSYTMASGTTIVFSGWVYLDVDPNLNNTGQPILSNGLTSGAQDGYSVFIDTSGRLNIRLSEAIPSNAIDTSCQILDVRTIAGSFSKEKWHHFTIVVAGHSAVGDYQTSVSMYYNGQKVATQNGTTGANPTYNSANIGIDVGYGYAEDFNSGESKKYIDGSLADLVMFSIAGTVSEAQAKSLYEASFSGVRILTSGFLNSSTRLLLRDLDNRDPHPTIARNSTDGRLGNHSIFFDDSKASDPAPNSSVSYPTMLPVESSLLGTITSSYYSGDLSTAASAANFSSYDAFYKRDDQPAIPPFIESNNEYLFPKYARKNFLNYFS